MDHALIRAEFPQAPGLIYLNHAAVAPWPRRAQEAVAAFATENVVHGSSRHQRFNEREERLRRQLQELINAPSPDDIALLKNTSEAISVVASGARWKQGDNVVTTAEEFPSNWIPWDAQPGVSLRQVNIRGPAPEEALMAACDKRTRVLAVSSVQFSSGIRLELAALGDFCSSRNILFCVDAIQSLGACQLDAQAVKAHFIMADGHKWLLGPEGLALFYAHEAVRDELRLRQHGWRMVEGPGDYDAKSWRPARSARRFEPGSPNMLGIHGLSASLSLFEELGCEEIEAALRDKVSRLMAGLANIDRARLVTPSAPQRRAGIVSFQIEGADHPALHRRLLEKQVMCACRGGGLRFSPHFYTPDQDIDKALDILALSI